jgi:hypothetical protein
LFAQAFSHSIPVGAFVIRFKQGQLGTSAYDVALLSEVNSGMSIAKILELEDV